MYIHRCCWEWAMDCCYWSVLVTISTNLADVIVFIGLRIFSTPWNNPFEYRWKVEEKEEKEEENPLRPCRALFALHNGLWVSSEFPFFFFTDFYYCFVGYRRTQGISEDMDPAQPTPSILKSIGRGFLFCYFSSAKIYFKHGSFKIRTVYTMRAFSAVVAAELPILNKSNPPPPYSIVVQDTLLIPIKPRGNEQGLLGVSQTRQLVIELATVCRRVGLHAMKWLASPKSSSVLAAILILLNRGVLSIYLIEYKIIEKRGTIDLFLFGPLPLSGLDANPIVTLRVRYQCTRVALQPTKKGVEMLHVHCAVCATQNIENKYQKGCWLTRRSWSRFWVETRLTPIKTTHVLCRVKVTTHDSLIIKFHWSLLRIVIAAAILCCSCVLLMNSVWHLTRHVVAALSLSVLFVIRL